MSKFGTQWDSKPGLVKLALIHEEIEKFFSSCALFLEFLADMLGRIQNPRTLRHAHSPELVECGSLGLLVLEVIQRFHDLLQICSRMRSSHT